jgi:hypothetical protein
MDEQKTAESRFWLFDLDNCRGSDLLEAGLLYRRFGADAVRRIEQHIARIADNEDSAEDDEGSREWTAILDRLRSLVGSAE